MGEVIFLVFFPHFLIETHLNWQPMCLYPSTDIPLPEGGWTSLQLVLVTVVPCLLLLFAILIIVFMARGHPWPCRARIQDPEEALDEQTLMSPDKCLKDLIYDMTTSGSGSGNSTEQIPRPEV